MNRRDERFFRKQLLIHPRFQLTLIAINWTVITVIFAMLRLQSSRIFSDMSPLAGLSKITGSFARSYLTYQADQLNAAIWICYLVAMIASGGITLMVSYRFVGPIVRLKSYFTALSQPEIPIHDLNFRTGDFFSDLPPVVNSAVKRCQEDKTGTHWKRTG